MNVKHLTAIFALLSVSVGTYAQSTDYVRPDQNFVSAKTRAEVVAELKQAQANTSYVVGGDAYVGTPVFAKSKTVRGDTIDTASGKKAAPGKEVLPVKGS